MIPHQIIYIIERFKFEATFLYYGLMVTILASIIGMSAYPRPHSSQLSTPEYQPVVYPISHRIPESALSAATLNNGAASTDSIWPIHGKVTTQFGEYHEPWQATHTGIDISSAKPAGVTPVAAFHAGVVVQVVHSSVSFGNHVVIDHGAGLTSLYGHMTDTTVTVGQHVQAGDIVGHEGSTGDSTGPHVHFETDINGLPVSPRRFLSGNP